MKYRNYMYVVDPSEEVEELINPYKSETSDSGEEENPDDGREY